MPQILTKYFGSMECHDEAIIRLPTGLPAFEEETRFLAIEPVESAPLCFLQSLRQQDLCFLTLPILTIDPAYRLIMTPEDIESLGLEAGRQPLIGAEVDCLAVLVAPENGSPTVNLLAPVVINRHNRVAIQAIRLDSIYSHQHPLLSSVDVCS